MKNVLIVGATSAIAIACCRHWAAGSVRFFLVARHAERLQQVANDLTARGAGLTVCHSLDINSFDQHAAMLDRCLTELGMVDIVLVASGTLPDQAKCQVDVEDAVSEFTTNATAVIALLTRIANVLEAQRCGTLAVISSVAGDRGRPSNYLYGSAKAALSTFCEGLHARLFKAGAHVLVIKPGFVATPMSAGLQLPKPLVASADKVAREIVKAIENRKDVLYTLWFWRYVMWIIRSIPRFVFKRTSL